MSVLRGASPVVVFHRRGIRGAKRNIKKCKLGSHKEGCYLTSTQIKVRSFGTSTFLLKTQPKTLDGAVFLRLVFILFRWAPSMMTGLRSV